MIMIIMIIVIIIIIIIIISIIAEALAQAMPETRFLAVKSAAWWGPQPLDY